MKKPFVRILLGSMLTIALFTLVCNHYHPILLKWIEGSAKIIGKPINASVYTDDTLNNKIIVYQISDDKNLHSYLLSLKYLDQYSMLKYIYIDPNEKWVGRPVGTNKECYDIINGTLFQSEVGSHFADFKNDMKGFNFDPQLTVTNKKIKFNLPPHWLKFNSIRIMLN